MLSKLLAGYRGCRSITLVYVLIAICCDLGIDNYSLMIPTEIGVSSNTRLDPQKPVPKTSVDGHTYPLVMQGK